MYIVLIKIIMRMVKHEKNNKQEKTKKPKLTSPDSEGIIKGLDGHINALKNGNVREQLSAIKALGKIKDRKAFEALVETIKENKWLTKSQALWRLSETGNPEAAELFENVFNDKSNPYADHFRRNALAGLGKINNPITFQIVVNALEDESWLIRLDACRILGAIKGADSIDLLVGLVNDKDRSVRIALAETLGKIDSQKTVEVLSKLLEDKDPWVRVWAVKSLGKNGGQEAIQVILKVIKESESEDVKRFAASVLSENT
jgi:HEAT repeat protein